MGFLFARHCPTPVVSTLHGRLDQAGAPELLEEFSDIPLVSISDSQRRFSPESNWVAAVHHGLPFENVPFSEQPGDYLAVVGRITPEKGIEEAIELARRTGLQLRRQGLRRAREGALRGGRPAALDDPDLDIEFLGEVDATAIRCLRVPWPRSCSHGRNRSGSLRRIPGHRHAGDCAAGRRPDRDDRARRRRFLVDDVIEAELAVQQVGELDRRLIRKRALERFSPTRMAEEYEAIYRRVIAEQAAHRHRPEPDRNWQVPAVGFGMSDTTHDPGPDASDRLDGVARHRGVAPADRRQRHDPHRHGVLDRPDDDRGRRVLPGRRRQRRGAAELLRQPVPGGRGRRDLRAARAAHAELWVERTPPDFVFDIKAHALMTGQPTETKRLPKDLRSALPAEVAEKPRIYAKDLPDALRDDVWAWFADGLEPLKEAGQLGSILLQYPRWFFTSSRTATRSRGQSNAFGRSG